MKRLFLTSIFAVAALSLAACATQSTAQHHAATLGGSASRVVELPGTPSAGEPREVRVLVVAGAERLRLDPTHAVVLAPNVPHAVEPDTGTDLVLLVHHLGRGEQHHQ